MAVRHLPSNEVHRGIKGGKTGCGFDTGYHPPHWRASSQKVTCLKVGCRKSFQCSSTRTGNRRKVKLADIQAYLQCLEALDELSALDQELGLGYEFYCRV